jgi:hypothetical protein
VVAAAEVPSKNVLQARYASLILSSRVLVALLVISWEFASERSCVAGLRVSIVIFRGRSVLMIRGMTVIP